MTKFRDSRKLREDSGHIKTSKMSYYVQKVRTTCKNYYYVLTILISQFLKLILR